MFGCRNNYAAGAAHLEEMLRCICSVSICAKTLAPFHKFGIFLWCTFVTKELIGKDTYQLAIQISCISDLGKGITTLLPGRETERMYKFSNVLFTFYLP